MLCFLLTKWAREESQWLIFRKRGMVTGGGVASDSFPKEWAPKVFLSGPVWPLGLKLLLMFLCMFSFLCIFSETNYVEMVFVLGGCRTLVRSHAHSSLRACSSL